MELINRRRWATAKQLCNFAMNVLHNFFRFYINTKAFCLDRYSLHILPLKSSMADLLEQNIKREKERKMHHMWRPKVEYESRGRTFIMIIITKMSMRPFFLRDDIDGSNPTWWAKWKCLNRYIVTFVYPCNLRIIVYANHFWTCQVLSCSDFSYSCNELLVNSYFDSPKESNRRSLRN